MRHSNFVTALLLGALLAASGCSSKHPALEQVEEQPELYSVATRQLPPQPTYGRVMWVRPPQVSPTRRTERTPAPLIMPVMSMTLDNAPLKEAVLVLAGATGYQTYCADSIADRQLSMDSVGTMEELAHEIEAKAKIDVILDHHNREVRFLQRSVVAPTFKGARRL